MQQTAIQTILRYKQIACDSFSHCQRQQRDRFLVLGTVILQQVFAEFCVGKGAAAMPDQDLAELHGDALVETLQDQISPSAWPKLILMPRASVTLRPGETSFTSPF